jgi:hypothetical protein
MRLPLAVLVVAAITSFAALAAADLPSPEESLCQGKKSGDACGDGGFFSTTTTCPCTCQDGTCFRGGGGPGKPGTSFPCQTCQSGGDASVAPAAEAGADAGVDAGTSAPAAPGSGGCGVSRMGPLAGAFGIAMAVPLLLRRRRRP